MKTGLESKWANEAMRRAVVQAAKARRESIKAEGVATVSVKINIDMEGFVKAFRNLAEAMQGKTALGDHYYRTRDGRIHRRDGSSPLLHKGGKP